LLFVGWQSREIRRSSKATEKATELSIASERAWVMEHTVAFTAGGVDVPDGRDQVFIQCVAKNHGRTPARVLGMNALRAIGPISDPGQTWDEVLYDFKAQNTPRWVILPDKNTALHCAVPDLKAVPGQILISPIATGESTFIHGVIRYWDMFSETDRFTRFCYRFCEAGELPGKPAGFYRAGGDRYNQQT